MEQCVIDKLVIAGPTAARSQFNSMTRDSFPSWTRSIRFELLSEESGYYGTDDFCIGFEGPAPSVFFDLYRASLQGGFDIPLPESIAGASKLEWQNIARDLSALDFTVSIYARDY